jgi:hypothetical protein
MIIVAANLMHVTDISLQSLYSGRQMNSQTTANPNNPPEAAHPGWSDGRRAAVVEAAYLLDLIRR